MRIMALLKTESDHYSERAIDLYRKVFGEVFLDQVPVDRSGTIKGYVVCLAQVLDLNIT